MLHPATSAFFADIHRAVEFRILELGAQSFGDGQRVKFFSSSFPSLELQVKTNLKLRLNLQV